VDCGDERTYGKCPIQPKFVEAADMTLLPRIQQNESECFHSIGLALAKIAAGVAVQFAVPVGGRGEYGMGGDHSPR